MNASGEQNVLIQDAVVKYGAMVALQQVSLEVNLHQHHVLLGESGSGKTTLLRAIAGFEPLVAGTIQMEGNIVDDPAQGQLVPPEHRKVGLVFQDYALFPHLTVSQNIAFGMERNSELSMDQLLSLVGLSGYEHRSVGALSGGEQQRVALARAIAQQPRIVLLDEPFSNLNRELRRELRYNTSRILKEQGVGALFVTHDPDVAFAVADVISVMHQGQLLQTGAPQELYDLPINLAVARSLGEAHVFTGHQRPGEKIMETPLGNIPFRAHPEASGQQLLLRPEQIHISEDSAQPHAIKGRIERRTFNGAVWELQVRIPDGSLLCLFVAGDKVPPTDEGYVVVNGEGILV